MSKCVLPWFILVFIGKKLFKSSFALFSLKTNCTVIFSMAWRQFYCDYSRPKEKYLNDLI